MDELMAKASGLVLSSKTNSVCENSARSDVRSDGLPFESYVSSVGLLKSSILDSIKNRCVEEVEVIEAEISNRRKSKWHKDVADRPLESRSLKAEKPKTEKPPNSVVLEENIRESIKESAVPDTSHAAFNTVPGKDEAGTVSEETIEMNQTNPLYDEASKRVAENGFKLARRKFSSTIFENCSTYDLACSEVLLKNDDVLSGSGPASSEGEERPTCEPDKPALDKPQEIVPCSVSSDTETEESVSLCDSFFDSVTDAGVDRCDKSYFRKRISSYRDTNTLTQLTSSLGSGATVFNYDKTSDAHPTQSKGRKHSRRGRKRQKKKRNGSSLYTCPRCRVSYSLSPDTLSSTVRCLHCDFWSTVEPVFVKHEKMVWNVCRIC